MGLLILKTERLLLRSWSEIDAESLYAYAKDAEIGMDLHVILE
jgi:RimJ/RimL family protein N-acetyltransferase